MFILLGFYLRGFAAHSDGASPADADIVLFCSFWTVWSCIYIYYYFIYFVIAYVAGLSTPNPIYLFGV
jgi:hypothetical protein